MIKIVGQWEVKMFGRFMEDIFLNVLAVTFWIFLICGTIYYIKGLKKCPECECSITDDMDERLKQKGWVELKDKEV